ncbi:hypothetical protein [Dactylosporangium sp. CA-139066]|uniref:hypothetical protein n=1 Tax=Dactylosporangium sp. CA-139066 TaxID=3239930 RepID=UPI003D8B7E36
MSNVATQRLSHAGLIRRPDTPDSVDRKLDAIIVPSARPASSLIHAAWLAEELNVPLMVLSSRKSLAVDVVRKIEDNTIVVDVVAVDVRAPVRGMPALETDTMFKGTPFHRPTDVSVKRNLGLLLARSIGWQRVMFLDDDIAVPTAQDLHRAAAELSGRHAAVGLRIGGMPDNSVVCHARRELGEDQGTFLGGGALAVPTDINDEAFFPNIYNEDWFFLLDKTHLRPVTEVGEAKQLPYDPFVNPARAREEELGDTLAEGVFGALSDSGSIEDVLNEGYWRDFLEARRRLITTLLGKAGSNPPMVEALKAARGRSYLIEPRACVRFLRAWQRDQLVWGEAVGNLRTGRGIAGALRHFLLDRSATIRLNRTGRAPKEPHLHQQRMRLERVG